MKTHVSRQASEKTARVGTPSQGIARSSADIARCQPVSPCDDLHIFVAKRTHELSTERGYRHGRALDDWREAEREILSQIPPCVMWVVP